MYVPKWILILWTIALLPSFFLGMAYLYHDVSALLNWMFG